MNKNAGRNGKVTPVGSPPNNYDAVVLFATDGLMALTDDCSPVGRRRRSELGQRLSQGEAWSGRPFVGEPLVAA